MQMSPPVNRISLSTNGIGPTCRFLNWSQAHPGQMCKQEHVFLVWGTGAARPHGGGEEENTWQAIKWRTRSGWKGSPGMLAYQSRLGTRKYLLTGEHCPGCPQTCQCDWRKVTALLWPWDYPLLRVLIDALTCRCDLKVIKQPERFLFPLTYPKY